MPAFDGGATDEGDAVTDDDANASGGQARSGRSGIPDVGADDDRVMVDDSEPVSIENVVDDDEDEA